MNTNKILEQKTFGERLKVALVECGTNAHQLAQLLEITPAAVYKWMNGGGVTPDNVVRVAGHLGIPPSTLYFGTKDETARFLQQEIDTLKARLLAITKLAEAA